MNLNRAMIIGNLTRDPETRTTPNGATVSSFGVATTSSWKDAAGTRQERVEYHNIVAWGKLAEICQQYLGKGRKVYVEGRLQTREWEGKDGAKRTRTEIVADNMIMLDRAPQGAPGAAAASWGASAAAQVGAAAPAPMPEARQEDEIKVEDIPF
jgi:single-strand DNA-binding protein